MRKTIYKGWTVVSKNGTRFMGSNEVDGDFIVEESNPDSLKDIPLFDTEKEAEQYLKDVEDILDGEWKVVPFESNIQF